MFLPQASEASRKNSLPHAVPGARALGAAGQADGQTRTQADSASSWSGERLKALLCLGRPTPRGLRAIEYLLMRACLRPGTQGQRKLILEPEADELLAGVLSGRSGTQGAAPHLHPAHVIADERPYLDLVDEALRCSTRRELADQRILERIRTLKYSLKERYLCTPVLKAAILSLATVDRLLQAGTLPTRSEQEVTGATARASLRAPARLPREPLPSAEPTGMSAERPAPRNPHAAAIPLGVAESAAAAGSQAHHAGEVSTAVAGVSDRGPTPSEQRHDGPMFELQDVLPEAGWNELLAVEIPEWTAVTSSAEGAWAPVPGPLEADPAECPEPGALLESCALSARVFAAQERPAQLDQRADAAPDDSQERRPDDADGWRDLLAGTLELDGRSALSPLAPIPGLSVDEGSELPADGFESPALLEIRRLSTASEKQPMRVRQATRISRPIPSSAQPPIPPWETEPKREPKTKTEPRSEPKSEPKAKTEPKSEPKAKTEPKAIAERPQAARSLPPPPELDRSEPTLTRDREKGAGQARAVSSAAQDAPMPERGVGSRTNGPRITRPPSARKTGPQATPRQKEAQPTVPQAPSRRPVLRLSLLLATYAAGLLLYTHLNAPPPYVESPDHYVAYTLDASHTALYLSSARKVGEALILRADGAYLRLSRAQQQRVLSHLAQYLLGREGIERLLLFDLDGRQLAALSRADLEVSVPLK